MGDVGPLGRSPKRLKVGPTDVDLTMASVADMIVPGILEAASGMPSLVDLPMTKTTARRKVIVDTSDEEDLQMEDTPEGEAAADLFSFDALPAVKPARPCPINVGVPVHSANPEHLCTI